jgi:hypothetical protein
MGFWGSVVNAAANVGHWVANNTGTILTAAKAIAKVALQAAAEDEKHKYIISEDSFADTGGNILPKLAVYVQGAEDAMKEQAINRIPAPPLNAVTGGNGSDADLQDVVSLAGPFDLAGLWPAPANANIVGDTSTKSPPNVTADLDKFFMLNGIPVVLGQKPLDVGDSASNQIFNPDAAEAIEGTDMKITRFAVTTDKKDVLIQGGMVFYPVPVGPGDRQAWHSHIRAWLLTKKSAKDELVEALRATSIASVATEPPPHISYNSTTITTRWQGTRNVADIMTAAVKTFVRNVGDQAGVDATSVNDGTNFKYQFWSMVDVAPGDVRAGLAAAIGKVLTDPKFASAIPRMPDVKIQNTITYVSTN